MSTYAKAKTTRNKVLCLDGGGTHSWENKGLDIADGELVSVRKCVWCGKETHRAARLARRTYVNP